MCVRCVCVGGGFVCGGVSVGLCGFHFNQGKLACGGSSAICCVYVRTSPFTAGHKGTDRVSSSE